MTVMAMRRTSERCLACAVCRRHGMPDARTRLTGGGVRTSSGARGMRVVLLHSFCNMFFIFSVYRLAPSMAALYTVSTVPRVHGAPPEARRATPAEVHRGPSCVQRPSKHPSAHPLAPSVCDGGRAARARARG